MVILTTDEPADAAEVLAPAVRHLMPPVAGGKPFIKEHAASATRAIPLFSVPLDQARERTFVFNASPRGWRYLIVGNGPMAIADLREKQGRTSFAQLTKGPIAERTAQAVGQAERDYGVTDEKYEVRFLDIPALGVTALWLHGIARDVFYPIHEGASRRSFKLGEDPKFVDHVVESALAMRSDRNR
jgi:hypothetical protein